MKIDPKLAAAVVIILILAGVAYAEPIAEAIDNVREFLWPTEPPDDVVDAEFSSFHFTGVQKDATATKVTSATTRVWWDENADGFMDYDEIGSFTEATGVYTSNLEYPIGSQFDLWVQIYAATYEVTYKILHMSGDRNSDGSAKPAGEIECMLTDDSVTYAGEINGATWTTGTNYNYTLSGATGEAEIEITLSAADKGFSSNLWEGVDYETAYGIERDLPFFVYWDQITDDGIADASVMAPYFFGIYMTVQDKVDLAPTVSHFDYYGDDNTNWYGIQFIDASWGDLFYNTADATAPRPSITFDVGTITAAGTTIATYGVGICIGLTYEEMVSFKWTASATYKLGTCGDDWDWEA